MLGKLLKHELRATAHTMLPILGIMLLVSAMANLGLRFMDGRSVPAVVSVMCTLIVVIFAVGLLAMGMVAVFMMVRRFRDNLLRDEGYIMHTLPVSVHAQIWSKVIVSSLWYALTGAAVVLSCMLAAADIEFIRSVGKALREFMRLMSEDIKNIEILFEVLALLVLGALSASLSFDAALAVGHSFPSRKMLISVCVFVAMLVLSQTAAALISKAVNDTGLLDLVDSRVTGFMAAWRAVCAYAAALLAAYGAVCYAITAYFLKRHLNLE